ncbi:acylphosphatase [Bifidobacterium aesculapii]|uniref:acylphosphatase n=1 Tax=Bifidobacterium aesculapii TaxID=1329411 RepID=UPI0009E67D76|nr:acylphosphatase [Bifidobacterium aesculapii]
MDDDKGCADVIRVHAVVTGMVQGVGFRYFVVTRVRAIGGISGWVRNRYDGSVEVEAQGGRGAIAQLVSALKTGPRWAHVEHVAVDELEPDGRSGNRSGARSGNRLGGRLAGRAKEPGFRVLADA